MWLVSNLAKKSEWKDVSVWLRLGALYRFFLNPDTFKVDVEKFNYSIFNGNLGKIHDAYPKSVMLYDVEEHEKITIDASPFPVLICTSARDFRENFPAIAKVLHGNIVLIDPMNAEEFSAAAQLFKILGNSHYTVSEGKNLGKQEATFLNAKHEGRVIFRKLFSKESIGFGEIEFRNIAHANPLNIPSSVNSIVGVTFDFKQSNGKSLDVIMRHKEHWKLLFLKDSYAIKMAKLIHTPDHVAAMRAYGLSYQLQQIFVLFGGLLVQNESFNLPKAVKVRNWEWFGIDTSTSIENLEPILELWPTCTSLCTFDAKYLGKPFHSLLENYVYTSALVNGGFYDYFTLKKVATGNDYYYHLHFFQVTELKAKHHRFTFKNFFEVLTKLRVSSCGENNITSPANFSLDKRICSINFYMITPSNDQILQMKLG